MVAITFCVSTSRLADGRVPVAEAGCATELVVKVDTEVTRLASITLLSLDIPLTGTHSGDGVALRLVTETAGLGATAGLATLAAHRTC